MNSFDSALQNKNASERNRMERRYVRERPPSSKNGLEAGIVPA